MTKLVTIAFVRVDLYQDGNQSHICEGELDVFEDPNHGFCSLIVGDFKLDLDEMQISIKSFDSLEYTILHSKLGSEYTFTVHAVDDDAIVVLDKCLAMYSKFTKLEDNFINRAARFIKSLFKTLLEYLRKWLGEILASIKHKTPDSKVDDDDRGQQLIDEARRDPNRQFNVTFASVKAPVPPNAKSKSPGDPESLTYTIKQLYAILQSAEACIYDFLDELKELAEEKSADFFGIKVSYVRDLTEILKFLYNFITENFTPKNAVFAFLLGNLID